MAGKDFTPYVPSDQSMPELTFKALLFGILMAIALGAANAYLGMKVGLTVAATFPAAVVAMAVLRPFRGSVLEENITRTSASVGEALVAGAIFTIPAFVISGVWEEIHLLESALIMLVGGILGVLFVIMLRRTLVEEADLPFPESMAAAEVVKAGQKGETGAGFVFGAMGIAAFWELFINSRGLTFVADHVNRFISVRGLPDYHRGSGQGLHGRNSPGISGCLSSSDRGRFYRGVQDRCHPVCGGGSGPLAASSASAVPPAGSVCRPDRSRLLAVPGSRHLVQAGAAPGSGNHDRGRVLHAL